VATSQLSITVPKELAERAQALVDAGEARSLSGYLSSALARQVELDEQRARSHALVDRIFGLDADADADAAAGRVVEVLHAQAAALAWVRDVTGEYPAPRLVSEAVAAQAAKLRTSKDGRDPRVVLHQTAADALARLRADG
jgi:hypothetical protein